MKTKAMEFKQRTKGEASPLYLTAVPAEFLYEEGRAAPDVYDAGKNPGGYQREPIESRLKEISRYVRDHEGLLPTSVLVNVREGLEFKAEGDVVDGIRLGTITIPDDARLWVVDGQHRVAGIQDALDDLRRGDAEAELGYDVPVVLTPGLPREDEMRLFHIVNSKARSVPTDLAADLIRRQVLREGKDYIYSRGTSAAEKEFRKAVGAAVAEHLNSTPGPWQGKIRLPNEKQDVKNKPMQINAVASSLEPALRDSFIDRRCLTPAETDAEWPTIRGWVHTYWSALATLMPEAFDDIAEHNVQRTAGLYAFHLLLPDVLDRCHEARSFTVDQMAAILKPLDHWVVHTTWRKADGDPRTSETGMKQIRRLAEDMRGQLDSVESYRD